MNDIRGAWRWYFWVFAIVVALWGVKFNLREGFTDWWSFGYLLYTILCSLVNVLALVFLYCFVWQVRFGRQQYWIAFFFVNVILFFTQVGYSLVAVYFFPSAEAYVELSKVPEITEHVPRFIEYARLQFLGMSLLYGILLMPMFMANYRYAFRSKHLWATSP